MTEKGRQIGPYTFEEVGNVCGCHWHTVRKRVKHLLREIDDEWWIEFFEEGVEK